jgi:NADH dehydrogenase FAD-containing subunit
MSRKRIVVLGGGFAGVYTATYLEQSLGAAITRARS